MAAGVIKIFLLIAGVVLLFFALLITVGTLASWVNGTTKSFLVDVIYLCLLVFPSALGGVVLCSYSLGKLDQVIAVSKKILRSIFLKP